MGIGLKEGQTQGHIEVIAGPMFAGKTEELIRRLRRERIGGGSFIAFRPKKDDRYGDSGHLFSHNGDKFAAELINVENEDEVYGILDIVEDEDPDVIAFDESNFWQDNLVDVCDLLAHDYGKRVIVAGLDLDFRGEPFHPTPKLMALARYVDKVYARCVRCGEPGYRTQRIIDGEPAHYNDKQIVVGGEENYEARCSSCHQVPGKQEARKKKIEEGSQTE